MKVLYLALAGGSTDHLEHQAAQMQTWAMNSGSNAMVIWMHGDPSIHEPKMVGNDLYVPVKETYENLLLKTLTSIAWVLKNIEFDYLIRTNTSNYFFHPLVVKHLQEQSPYDKVAGGVIAKWRGTIKGVKKNYRYISGAGIFLSFSAAQILASMESKEYEGVPDDVAIGSFLDKQSVKFFKVPRNNITDFKLIWPSPQTRVKSWKNSHLTVQRMRDIHSIYTKHDFMEIINFTNLEIERCQIEKPRRALLLRLQFRLIKFILRIQFRKADVTL